MGMRYVLSALKKKGVDDIVITEDVRTNSQIKFVNNNISITKTWKFEDISVFVVKDKRIGVTNIRNYDKSVVDKTINNLIKVIKSTPENKEWIGLAKGPFKYKDIKTSYDKKIANLDEQGIDHVETAINAALDSGAKRTTGTLNFGVGKTSLLTSNNIEAEDQATAITFSLRAFAKKNASAHKVTCSRVLRDFKPGELGQEAGRLAKLALNPKRGEVGKFDIIFEPLPFANLLNQVMTSASIFSVEAGLSFLKNKLNKSVANSNVTLFDDGTLQGGINSSKFDAEGVPSQRNMVIDKGELKTYLHNTSTAKRYGVKTTANAGLIAPEPTNIILKKGTISHDKLFENVKKGLWITNLWYTRFNNYDKGDFSTIPRDAAFLIENGEVKHPVQGIRLSDNMLNILNSIKAIGNQPKQIIGWEVETPTITPPVLVRGLNITRPTKS